MSGQACGVGLFGPLDEAPLRAQLARGVPLRLYDAVDSTNTAAKAWAAEGAPHGALVAAARQSGGRGRFGKSFESPPGGVYLSVVLRGAQTVAPGLVTAAAAVAAHRAILQRCGICTGIKWVNDLYHGGLKCCGILAETVLGEGGHTVVGVGVNLAAPPAAFSPAVAALGASLFPGGCAPASREALAAAIHTQLLQVFAALPNAAFLEEYRRHSLLPGRRVTVLAAPPYEALALGIDGEARLVVQTDGGEQAALSYGEVSVRL